MTQVFISYSRKDLEFVDRLANDLKSTGFEVWYDLSGLEPGTRWRQEIQKAIQDSQYFLVVLSPNSIVSDWVEREFLFASDQDIKIIPILYQPCTLPMWSLNLHFIDMQGKNYALHYQELLKVMGIKTRSEENPIAIRYLEIGDEYRKRGQASQAIESYQQALAVDPGNLKARTNIGAVHLLGQEYTRAVEAYELALQISSEDLLARAGWCDANMALGNQARAEGRLEEATRYYLEILRIDPQETDARRSLVNIHTSRAESLLAAGQEEDALAEYAQVIKYGPDDPLLASRLEKMQAEKQARLVKERLARSEGEIAAGNWDQALATLNEALQIAPRDAAILNKISHITARQLQDQLEALLTKVGQAEKEQRWDAAMSGLNEYLRIKPEDQAIQKRMDDLMQSKHAAWLAAVTVRVDQSLASREWEAALAALNEALLLEPHNRELLARAERVKQDQQIAKMTATMMRADQAATAGRWEDAISILNTALGNEPGNLTLKSKLAETLQARRKLHLQSVLNLVEAAERAGKWESALASLNQVLADEPDNAEFLEKYNHILALERESRLNDLRIRAKTCLKEQKYEEALAAWNETLLLAPENRQAILTEIEAVNKSQKLETSYSEGLLAYTAKDYQKAINLFESLEVPGYKDATKLQAKSRKLLPSVQKKTRPAGKRNWVLVAMLLVLALGIGSGIFWLVKNTISPPATPTLLAGDSGSSPATPWVPSSTPDPRKTNPANQHQYQLIGIPYSWQDARDDCIGRGGYLATIQDAVEDQFIYQLIPTASIWLGASDENEEGNWSWVTGEPWMYTNWAESQPDNDLTDDSSGENYLALLWPESPSQWNDAHNGGGRPYICEWEPVFPQRKTIKVTSVEDTGPGTLRQALLDARAGDTIIFDPATFPPADPVAINLYSALPVIDQGYLTLDASDTGVVLNGSHAGGDWTPGIDIWSDYNIIQGLGIVSFSGPGIALETNANFNTIGGDRALGLGQIGQGVFVGNNSDGMAVLGSDNVITGNLVGIIGVDAEDFNVGNRAAGIFLAEKASRNTVGPDNIIAFNGTVGGCGIEFTSLEAMGNNLTANIIYANGEDSPPICYNVNPAGQFVYSTPPAILFFELGTEIGSAAGQTCEYCRVEIYSTDGQDAQIFEGAVTANEYGNFVFYKSGEFAGPYVIATSRRPNENTSEFSLPTPKLTDIGIALNEAWVSKPDFGTSFGSWAFKESEIPFASLEDGKLVITNETGASYVEISNLSSDKLLVEFELSIREPGSINSLCYLFLSNNAAVESQRTLVVTFGSSNPPSLQHFDAISQNWKNIAVSSKPLDLTEAKKVTLVVVGNQVGVFIDRQVAYTTFDPAGSAVYSIQDLAAGNSIVCEFNNYQIWNLSDVNFNP